MSTDEPWKREPTRGWKVAGGVVAGIVILFLINLALRQVGPRQSQRPASGNSPEAEKPEDNLAAARAALLGASDAAGCAGALQLINAQIAQKPDAVPALDPKVKELIEPDPGELEELGSAAFTPLDARYLEEVLLLREAARALGVAGVAGDAAGKGKADPLDRAAAAFAWVTRQVVVGRGSEETVPPAYVLRRGIGDATERALVFLALLPQLNALGDDTHALHGSLVLIPTGNGDSADLWACGVTVGAGTDLYLFDPRAGLPLPGPGGKGVATLAAAVRDPAVLDQLDAPGGPAYDVKAAKAKNAQLWCAPTLSSLAPRMRAFERLLGPGLPVPLAADLPGDVGRLNRDAAASGGPSKVVVWKPGVRLLRRFLPPENGGAPPDKAAGPLTPEQAYLRSVVPLSALPRELLTQLHRLGLDHEISQRVILSFARPFQETVLKPGGPRDQMLRGRYAAAVEELLTDQGILRGLQQARADYPDLGAKAVAWFNERAVPAYADLQRARRSGNAAAAAQAQAEVEQMWKGKESAPVVLLTQGAAADVRLERVTFLIALCQHEKAVQAQARLDQAGATARAAQREKARDAWGEARSWWERYLGEYPDGVAAPAAMRLRGDAQAALGEGIAAADTWDAAAAKSPNLPEKLVNLYRARRARAEPGAASK